MKRHKIPYTFDVAGRRGRDKVVVLHDGPAIGFVFPSGSDWQFRTDELRAALDGGTGGPSGFRMSKSGGDLHVAVTTPGGSGVVRISASKMRAVIGR